MSSSKRSPGSPVSEVLNQLKTDSRLAEGFVGELMKRRRAVAMQRHQSLSVFVREFWSVLEPSTTLRWGWAMEALCDHLEAVTDGRIRLLLITVPPGMMKSLLVNVLWPAWEWGPKGLTHLRYLATSFKQEHATRDARRMRELVESAEYQSVYGGSVRLTRDGENDFENSGRGWRKARSLTSLTGERGDRVIIDDPNNLSRAESAAERKKVINVVTEVVPSRLNDPMRSAIVIIMQRAHERDAAGEVLRRKQGYVHLNLPMRCDPERRCSTVIGFVDPRQRAGELLFPERWDELTVQNLERDIGVYAAQAQLQQDPTSREGTLFKRDWFDIVDAPAVTIRRWVRAWDLASTEQSLTSGDPDWTVGLKGGVDEHGVIWIESMVRMRKTPGPRDADIEFIAKKDGWECVQLFPQDPGQAGKSQAESLRRQLGAFGYPKFKPVIRDKISRSNEALKYAEFGKIKLARFRGVEEFLDEICAFPGGAHDDIVDALSDLVEELGGDDGVLDLSGVF